MKKLLEVLKIFAGWRLALLFLTIVFVPLSQNFVALSNFDGLRFLNIAKEGYGTPHTFYSYSLFPLYPLMVKYFSGLMGYLGSGLFVSHFFALGSLILFKKLAELDYSKQSVNRSLILFLCFPASFFLISVYSESLFLFLCLAAVYLSRKKYYLLSGIMAFLATYTRSVGIFLWILLLVEYYQENKNNLKNILKPISLTLLIPPLGALYYFNYLQVNTSNVLNFLPTIPQKFVFLHQVILRYGKMLVFMDHLSPLFWVILTEAIVGFFALFLLVISYGKLRTSYWIYFFLSFFIPTLWGNFVGMPRFMIVVFPVFFFLGNWLERQHPYFQKFYYSVSVILLIINFSLFLNGIFVG